MRRVAINGLGRIGRIVAKLMADRPDIDLVAFNDLTDTATLAHLIKYDSNYGIYGGTVTYDETSLTLQGKKIAVYKEKDPSKLPWGELGVDVVVEATGFFTKKEGAQLHLSAGAKKVIITAPSSDADAVLCLGVNEELYDPASHHIISNGSCTTNCIAPIVKVLEDSYGIEDAFFHTIHSYTSTQKIHDAPDKDLRKGRGAFQSMIPTSTGADKTIVALFPQLKDHIKGIATRVPTPTVSELSLIVRPKVSTDLPSVLAALRARAALVPQVLEVTDESLVSIDFKGNPHSAIVDVKECYMVGDRLIHILGWYDNEMGYSNRVVDMTHYVLSRP